MGDSPMMTAADVIARLGLEPHPEGGYFRETFRDVTEASAGGRAASTAIYFLLPAGVVSAWHKVDAAEVWHWYSGDALELRIAEDGGAAVCHIVGPLLAAGQRPQAVVRAGAWQQAQSLGAWTLVGCTVAPGLRSTGLRSRRLALSRANSWPLSRTGGFREVRSRRVDREPAR